MTIEKEFFRQVMGQFATGVTVVATATDAGLSGLTVNSFTSVSLNPPLVLVCIDLTSQTLPFLRASGHFAVSFLTNEQEALSRCFATTSNEHYDRFCHASYHIAATGSPILDGALAFVDVRIVAEYPGGDHAIFLGEVQAMATDGKAQFLHAGKARGTLTEWSDEESDITLEPQQHAKAPLASYRGQYRHLARDYQRPSLAAYYDEDFE